jgi:signal transduction histidine kinase
MERGVAGLPRRDKFWIVLLASLVLAQAEVSLLLPRGDALNIASDLIQGTLLLVATAAFLPNAFPSRCSVRRTRAFWILMSAGMLFWLIYQGMWNYFEVFKRVEVPNPFLGDVVLFLHLVPMMAALALLPHLREDARDTRIRTLDFTLLLTWWIFLYVYTVIPWQTVHVDEPTYSNNLNVVYLTEKLVLLGALVILLYHAQRGWRNLYGQLLGASALYASCSYVANWAIARGTYYSGSIYDIPWTVSVAWLALVGKFAARYDLSQSKRSQPLLGVWITRAGMLAIFSLPCFALHAQLEASSPAPVRTFRTILSLLTMVVMGTMVFWRQRLLGDELSLLLKNSRRSFEELKTLQAQLVQSEKLASLGQLVGGAAHEINNPLTAMLGYSDLLSASTLPPPEQRFATCIAGQVRRTRTLVASLLTFARQAPARMIGADLNSILQTAMRLLAPQVDAQAISIHSEFGSALPPVLADSNQLLHVCLHLAGQISGRLYPEPISGLYVQTRRAGDVLVVDFSAGPPSSETPYQHLHDSDDGDRPATLALRACWRIVEEHGGRILSQRSREGYTAFRLELPAAKTASDSSSSDAAHTIHAAAGSSS